MQYFVQLSRSETLCWLVSGVSQFPHGLAPFVVAERASSLTGYALVCRGCEAHTGQRRLWLADLFVRPSARRGGVGRALMGAVAADALALGCAVVCWDLRRRNDAGAAFYRTLAAEEVTDVVHLRLGADRLSALARQR